MNLKGRILHKFDQIPNLTRLVLEDQYVLFPSDSGMEPLGTISQALVSEIVRERADLYGIVRMRKSTAEKLGLSTDNHLFFTPLALLQVPTRHDEYISKLPSQARNKIRKAQKCGYEYAEFSWNDHLDEIYAINTSKKVRQGEDMRGWYKDPVGPRDHSREELEYIKYFGAFLDGKLVAYLHFLICGDFIISKHVIGHADHLHNGIMNGLFSWSIDKFIEESTLRWVIYGVWLKTSLGEFKKHAGFKEYAVVLNFPDSLPIQDYLNHKSGMIWRL